MSNTRSLRNRSSRYSSPATFAPVNQEAISVPPLQETIEVRQPENGGQEPSQQVGWVEPTPRHGVASFEDTKGLERVGVLEHMQPLGVAPNSKLLQRLKVSNYRPSLSARATPVYSEGMGSPSVEPTREEVASPLIDPELLLDVPASPPPQQAPQQPQSQSEPEPEPEPPQYQAQSEPQSYPPPYPQPLPQYQPQFYSQPQAQPFMQPHEQQPPHPVIMSPPRGRPAKKEVEEMRVYPGPDDSFLSPIANGTPRSSRASPKYPPSVSEHSKDARIKAYLQNAIDKAYTDNKPDVAAGLMRVMDESWKDEVFTALDNISKFKASVRIEQFKVFKKYIKKGIRRHRRDSTRQLRFNDDRPPPPPQSQPVAYYSSFHMNNKRPLEDMTTNDDNAARPSPDHTSTFSETSNSASAMKLSAHSYSALDTNMADLPADLPSDRPSKPLSHSRRSSSGSSLSSAESLPSDYIATEAEEPANQDQAFQGRPTEAGAQRQVPARAASSRATRLSGINQHFRQPSAVGANPLGHQDLTSELIPYTGENARARKQKLTPAIQPGQNDAEIEEERQRLESQLIRFRHDWKTALVGDDIRSDVDDHKRMNPPKAMESYTGPPPPVIHPNALLPSAAEVSSPASYNGDTVTVNGASRKRPYNDYLSDESELSSMESLSPPPPPAHTRLSAGASSTRASTPRAAKAYAVSISRKKPRTMGS